MSEARTAPARTLPLGWILTACLLGYAVAIHHGVGPAPVGGATHWWQPRGFLLDWLSATSLGAVVDGPRSGLVVFSLPALVLAVAVWSSTRSAIARVLALASLLASMLFLFYGLGGNRPLIWTFFHWRGSAVMALTALVTAAALAAPLLAASWLRQGWALRLALYAPVFALVVLAQRDVTGTDPTLAFAISPWPVVPVFAIEIGATLVSAVLAVLALGAAGLALRRDRPALGVAVAGAAALVLGLAVFLRVRPGVTLLCLSLALAAAALATLALAPSEERAVAPPRARGLAVGALLVALPILAGTLLTSRDYARTRDDAAQRVIDSLQRYFAREQVYPDDLAQLVASHDIDVLPKPTIGFGMLEGRAPGFTYQSFGTSYLLEFSAPRWVQCAYNPPYGDDDGSEGEAAPEDDAAGASDGDVRAPGPRSGEASAAEDGPTSTHGAWSCPSKPPELW